jgi:hypothetical protein
MVKYIKWVFINKKHILSVEFYNATKEMRELTTKFIKNWLDSAPRNPPLQFDNMVANHIIAWFIAVSKAYGPKPGYQTYNTHRSALYNLFRDYKKNIDPRINSEISDFMK